MIFTQYYLDCLSQASYLIGDETTGQAVCAFVILRGILNNDKMRIPPQQGGNAVCENLDS